MRGLFCKSEEELLQKCGLRRICTTDEHGFPHCVRVDFLYHEGLVYIGSNDPRIWLKHISQNRKVAFGIDVYDHDDDGVFDFRGMMFKGEG